MLALTEPIGAPTNELKSLDRHRTLVVDPKLGSSVTGPSVLRADGLRRILRDQVTGVGEAGCG